MTKDYNNELLNDCAWFANQHRGKNKQSGPHWSTFIRFPKLFDEAVRLQAENEKLKEALREIAAKKLHWWVVLIPTFLIILGGILFAIYFWITCNPRIER